MDERRAEDQRAAKLAAMQALITEGIESGVSSKSMDEILAEARRLLKRASAPPSAG